MALHHLTLKAALNKYGPLFSNGMTVEELVKSISNDEKGFTKDEVAEIIEADGKAFIVLSEFRDKNDFSKIYSVGQDVSHLDSKVLQSLVERNLVELK